MRARHLTTAVVLCLMASINVAGLIPAQAAALSLTLQTDANPIAEGTRITLSGRAAGAKPGTIVDLQQRQAGSWITIASRRIDQTKSYSFRQTPALGVQRYRTKSRALIGQPSVKSVVVGIEVLLRTEATWQATRQFGSFVVQGSVTQSSPSAAVRLQKLVGTDWVDLETGPPTAFEMFVAYPTEEPLRLLIDGDADWMPFIAPLPFAGVLQFNTPLNQPVAVVDSLVTGRDASFNVSVSAGDLISVGRATPPHVDTGLWNFIDSSGSSITVPDIPNLWVAQADGAASATFHGSVFSLDGTNVTVWRALERDLIAPNTATTATLAGGRFLRIKTTLACTAPTVVFSVNNGDSSVTSSVWGDPPGGGDAFADSFSGGATLPARVCQDGDWKLTILRDKIGSGPVTVSYAFQ